MATPNKKVIDYAVKVRVSGAITSTHTAAAVSSAIQTALVSLGFGGGATITVTAQASNSALEINTRKIPQHLASV